MCEQIGRCRAVPQPLHLHAMPFDPLLALPREHAAVRSSSAQAGAAEPGPPCGSARHGAPTRARPAKLACNFSSRVAFPQYIRTCASSASECRRSFSPGPTTGRKRRPKPLSPRCGMRAPSGAASACLPTTRGKVAGWAQRSSQYTREHTGSLSRTCSTLTQPTCILLRVPQGHGDLRSQVRPRSLRGGRADRRHSSRASLSAGAGG